MRRHIVTGNATGADAGEAIMWGETHTDPSSDEKFFVGGSPAVFRRWQSSKPCPCILTRAASDTSLVSITENLSEEGAAMGLCVEKTGTAKGKTGGQITPQTTEHTLTRNKRDPDEAREPYE